MNKISPSQRMRHVIYRLWEKGDQKVDDQEYYEAVMDKLIEQLKTKLEEK